MFDDLDFDREEVQAYRENENFFDQFVISQDNGLIGAWNAFIILLKVGSGLWYLTMACFWQSEIEYIKDNPGSDPNFAADAWSAAIEVLFAIDLILCFFKEYCVSKGQRTVSNNCVLAH